MKIKRRRIAAYRFLKKCKQGFSGKPIILDLAMIPSDFNREEFIKVWKDLEFKNSFQIFNVK